MTCLRILGFSLLLSGIVGCSNADLPQDTNQGSDAAASVADGGTENGDGTVPSDGSDSGDPSDASAPSGEARPIFTHKMIKKTGENPFASLAYECSECTFEQWESIVAPPGWSKGPPQIGLFSSPGSVLRSYPPVEADLATADFLEDVPGSEYKVIAVTLDGRLISNDANGIVAEVQVRRDTRLVFMAGMRVHELTDPEGNVFVLFVHHVDTGNWQNVDFQSADALDYFSAPEGWVYSTRILDRELALDSNDSEGVVSVLAIRGPINSTWEKHQRAGP